MILFVLTKKRCNLKIFITRDVLQLANVKLPTLWNVFEMKCCSILVTVETSSHRIVPNSIKFQFCLAQVDLRYVPLLRDLKNYNTPFPNFLVYVALLP